MKVRMLQDMKGSPDGSKTVEYMNEHIYNVPAEMSDYLAKAWLQRGICEMVKPQLETKTVEPKETKKRRTRKPKVEE